MRGYEVVTRHKDFDSLLASLRVATPCPTCGGARYWGDPFFWSPQCEPCDAIDAELEAAREGTWPE